MTITASPTLIGILLVAQGLFWGFLLVFMLLHAVQYIRDHLKHRELERVERINEQNVLMAVDCLLSLVESGASEQNIARAQGALLQEYKARVAV